MFSLQESPRWTVAHIDEFLQFSRSDRRSDIRGKNTKASLYARVDSNAVIAGGQSQRTAQIDVVPSKRRIQETDTTTPYEPQQRNFSSATTKHSSLPKRTEKEIQKTIILGLPKHPMQI